MKQIPVIQSAEKLNNLYAKLARKAQEVSRLAADAEKPGNGRTNELFKAIREMPEMQQSFNMQYLTLQQNMQNENRQFTLVSNIMKTKHDTAKNAINNVR